MSEATVPYDTTCCPACLCGGGCRFAQAAVNRVNAHDDLVAACELALEHEECVCEDRGGCLFCILTAAIGEAEG